eukprot:gene17889-21340_t
MTGIKRLVLGLTLIALVLVALVAAENEHIEIIESQAFSEEMLVKPLPNGKILTHVQFSTEWASNFYDKSTCDMISRVGVEEMTLQFTQGRWSYEEWGYPVRSAPVGVELVAWLRPMPKGIDAQWRELTHSLSGLFCASMEFLYQVPHHTSSPSRAFRPEGASNVYAHPLGERATPVIVHANGTTTPLHMSYGILPRESVCTENLTPWVKLLPCREQAGLGRLLNPLRLYDVAYHSMSITVRRVVHNDQDAPRLEVVQTVTVVSDVPKPTANPAGASANSVEAHLERIFGEHLRGISACPLATRSLIHVQRANVKASPEPTSETGELLVYDLQKYSAEEPLRLVLTYPRRFKLATAPITAHSHLTGYGQERGGMAIQIYNSHEQAINVTYYQAIPWYLRLYFHTFRFTINEKEYRDRELSFELPGHSVAAMSIDFDKVFLHYTEHPPDANRGFDLGSGVVTAYIAPNDIGPNEPVHIEWSQSTYPQSAKQSSKPTPVRIYTEGLLITLPTPDFIFALFFGSMLNILIRRFRYSFTGEDFVSDRPIAKIYRRILAFIDGGAATEKVQQPVVTEETLQQ